jgi:lysophospholipase L1-like esterase
MRRALTRLLLGLVSFALAALLVEGLWRFVRSRGWGPTTNPAYVVHDDRLGWRYRPGARARHRSDEFDVSIRINSRGFRGPEVPLERTPGRGRVLALGDSFTFGWGVEEEQAWPAQLARILDVEVVNLGVSGYGTDQEYLLFQSDGLAYRPDLVLVQVAPNDAEEVLREVSYGRGKPRFGTRGDEIFLCNVPVPDRFLERASLFYRSLRRFWIERREGSPDARFFERGWNVVRRVLTEMEAESVRAGARFHVLVEDPPVSTPGVLPGESDLTPALLRVEGPMRFPRDGHWNARGHRVVAETVAAALRERGLSR